MRKPLTDRGVAALKPASAGKRVMTYDSITPGLAVMVTGRGAKSFVFYARFPTTKKPARRFIGKVGALSLSKAREKARQWRGLIAEGIDPAEHEAAQLVAEARRRANSFRAVAEEFIAQRVKGQRTAATTAKEIRKHLIARWEDRPITSITMDDVVTLCDEFRDRGIGAHAHNVFGHARRIIRIAIERRSYGLDRSPCENLSPAVLIGEKKARKRTLSDAEIRALWHAAGTLGYPYEAVFKLLLLTGARKSEVAEAQWPEFDIGRALWTVPAERFKPDRAHLVPLSGDALIILSDLPRFAGGGCMFSTTSGCRSVNGFSKVKARLDVAMQRLHGEADIRPWVIHDIRRTVRSRLSELRVPPVVAELVIGHQLPGLLRVYDQWEHLDEKRDALTRWANHLREIVGAVPCAKREPQSNRLITVAAVGVSS